MFEKPASLEEALRRPHLWSPIKGFDDVQVYACGTWICAAESALIGVVGDPPVRGGMEEFVGWDTSQQDLFLVVSRDDGTTVTLRAHRGLVEDGEVEAAALVLEVAIGTPHQAAALEKWRDARRRAARRALGA
jgi:hypothetical protein